MRRAGALLLAALAASSPAHAADVVVVEAKGIDLSAGQVLDGARPLPLVAGQKLTLITDDGRTIKLKGPSEAPPLPSVGTEHAGVATSLKGLLKAREADTSSAGVIRSGAEAQQPLPQPWLIDVRRGGDRCLREGELPVLWRSNATEGDVVEVEPADRSWRARLSWPQGSASMVLPAELPLRGEHAYVMTLDATPAAIVVHVLPASLPTDLARAAWMLNVGCTAQVNALIKERP